MRKPDKVSGAQEVADDILQTLQLEQRRIEAAEQEKISQLARELNQRAMARQEKAEQDKVRDEIVARIAHLKERIIDVPAEKKVIAERLETIHAQLPEILKDAKRKEAIKKETQTLKKQSASLDSEELGLASNLRAAETLLSDFDQNPQKITEREIKAVAERKRLAKFDEPPTPAELRARDRMEQDEYERDRIEREDNSRRLDEDRQSRGYSC